MKKWVYLFEEVAAAEKYAGSWDGVRSLLGGKGAGLFDMTRAGVPVPPGFTVTTEACNEFRKTGKFPAGQWNQQLTALKRVEKETGKKFGDPKNPLLVSCRSGAKSVRNHSDSAASISSLWRNFGFSSGSGSSPPAGT